MSDAVCNQDVFFSHGYGLSGGIATGKSTVCELLRSKGFVIIDADKVARKKLQEYKKELLTAFGESIFDGSSVDRAALAKQIFADEKERKKLEAIIHPPIEAEIKAQGKRLDALGRPYILDIPLLFESGKYLCRANAIVYAPKDLQLKRLKQRDGLSEAEAKKRLDAQMDIEEKKRIADWVIDNTQDKTHLEIQVDKFIEYIWGSYATK